MNAVCPYRPGRLLGQGAHATVHEALGPDGAAVALKRLHPQVVLLRPEAAERLRREVLAARSVDHPGVVKALDAGLEDGVPWVALELVRGARPITEAFEGLPLIERVGLVRDAARALGAAHARGVVHRDVSPGNVLVDQDGQVRVTDFGLAWVQGEARLTRTGAVLGTPSTLAPEVALEGTRSATPRSDVWSLGALLRMALKGEEVPPAVQRALASCLAERPAERPADGAALARLLEEAVAGMATVANHLTPPPSTHPGRVRPPRLQLPGSGARVGPYLLLTKLGEGGMGQVWRARHEALGREVALKLVPTSTSEERKRRALRELEAASRVRHENVVGVHDAGELPGALYLAMDLVDGAPLDAVLARGALAPRRAVELVLGVARALEVLHAAGIVHRDLKPANVLVRRDGAPVLTDFGVAHLADLERLTRTHEVVGTPMYMPPEQLAGERIDERADVYAAGVLLYETLTGVLPAYGETLVALALAKQAVPPAPSAVRPDAPPALDAVCLTALAPEPDERYPTMAALREDLERWLATGRAEATGPARGPDRRVVALGVAAALVSLLTAGAVAWRLRHPAGPGDLGPWRQEVEATVAGAGRLATLDLSAARARFDDLPPAARATPDARRVEACLALHALAGEDRAAAPPASFADVPGPVALALRGALAALGDGDPAAAVADLERARAQGVRARELERWRLVAIARRGVVDRVEAQALLGRLDPARTPGLDAATVARLRVLCHAALGDLAEARAALKDAPPAPDLRWAVALMSVAEHLQRGEVDRALAALRDVARPAGPHRPRELSLGDAALRVVRPLVDQRVAQGGSLSEQEVDRLSCAFELWTRLTPGREGPPDLADRVFLLLARSMHVSASSTGLAVADVWPEHLDLQLGALVRAYQGDSPEASRRLVAIAERALRLGGEPLLAHAAIVRHRHALGDLPGTRAALAGLEAAAARAAPGNEMAALASNHLVVYGALLDHAAGRTDEALARLDAADRARAPDVPAGERARARFQVLSEAGRVDALFERSAPDILSIDGTTGPRFELARELWRVGVRLRRWRDLEAFVTALIGGRADGEWSVRLACLRGVQGDLPGAAALLEEATAFAYMSDVINVEFLARLRAGDRQALRELLRSHNEAPDEWLGAER